VLILSGCRGWQGDRYLEHRMPASRRAREASYGFGLPDPAWRAVRNAEDVQVAWVNESLAAVIEVHAQCAEQGDSSLEQFTDHLRIDWTDWTVIEQRSMKLVGRDALSTVVVAKLDGVEIKSEFVLVKKSGCLFDLRYMAPPDRFDAGRPSFAGVVAGFRFPLEGG
jgi:hypothetical protein